MESPEKFRKEIDESVFARINGLISGADLPSYIKRTLSNTLEHWYLGNHLPDAVQAEIVVMNPKQLEIVRAIGKPRFIDEDTVMVETENGSFVNLKREEIVKVVLRND